MGVKASISSIFSKVSRLLATDWQQITSRKATRFLYPDRRDGKAQANINNYLEIGGST